MPLIEKNPTLKIHETDSKFIEAVSNCLYDVDGHNWYYMPFWFKKISEGVYQEFTFDELPPEVKRRIESNREQLNPQTNEQHS